MDLEVSFYTSVCRHMNTLYARGYEDDVPFIRKERFNPTLYRVTKEDYGWRSLDGKKVEPVVFDSMSKATAAIKEYDGIVGSKMYGQNNYIFQYITEKWPKDIQYDASLIKTAYLDIEVDSENGFPYPEQAEQKVLSIVWTSSTSDEIYVYTLDEARYESRENEIHVSCEDERELLLRFLNGWFEQKPDILTGWNVRGFDVPYLVNRMKKILDEESINMLSPFLLSPVYKERTVKIQSFYKTLKFYDIPGVQTLDYMELFQKFALSYPKQESYKLDHIAYVVLNARKLSYEEYGSLAKLYTQNPQRFVEYNVRDTTLVKDMDAKLGLISLTLEMAYMAGVNPEDTLGTIALWDSLIYRTLNEKHVCVWPNVPGMKDQFPGGYVKEPEVGMHEWVVSFDLNSLYPNLIVQYNMSPETLVDVISDVSVESSLGKDLSSRAGAHALAANGARFRKDTVGVLPGIIKDLYNERTVIKKQMLEEKRKKESTKVNYDIDAEIVRLNNRQMAVKIALNSVYGAMGNIYFRYYDLRVAEAVTKSGQLSILTAEKAANDYLNKVMNINQDHVIAIDTDSIYLKMNEVVARTMKGKSDDEICEKLDWFCGKHVEKQIAAAYDSLFTSMNAYENRMEMAREVIARRGIWRKKKNYALTVLDNEGVRLKEPQLKIMGIQAVKSNTPPFCRERLKEALIILLTKDETTMHDFVAETRKQFMQEPIENISSACQVSDVAKYTGNEKSIPVHVTGCLLHNRIVKNRPPIANGSSIKFIYLEKLNPTQTHVISYTDFFPLETKLEKYIDYHTQFEKTFLKPLTSLLDIVGWSPVPVLSIEDFFE